MVAGWPDRVRVGGELDDPAPMARPGAPGYGDGDPDPSRRQPAAAGQRGIPRMPAGPPGHRSADSAWLRGLRETVAVSDFGRVRTNRHCHFRTHEWPSSLINPPN